MGLAAADGGAATAPLANGTRHNGFIKHTNGHSKAAAHTNGVEKEQAYIEQGSRVIREIYEQEFGEFQEELPPCGETEELSAMEAVSEAVYSQLGPESEAGSFERCSLLTHALTTIGLYLLMLIGYINQLFFTPKVATERNRQGYAKLYLPFEQFFSRYLYRRVRHCFNRPIASAPAATLLLEERETTDYNWTFRRTGRTMSCLNLGSYNYLGFAGGGGGAAAARAACQRYGLALGSPRGELGSTALHGALERAMAALLGTEDAVVFGMGFATNALALPALLGPRSLVLSDRNNHASLILGLRLAGVTVRVFRHNDMRHLEQLVRAGIAERRWDRIVVVVEGVYSMEGSVCPLGRLVELRRRYGIQLYLDEAHSAGAMGPRGRGVAAREGVAPHDVDVLMGTFTKSFGAAGGYIAGSARLVRWLRAHGHAHGYAHALSPPVAAQVLWAVRALGGPTGAARVLRLRTNARYFRARLHALGAVVFGHRDSPVVPLLVYSFSKMMAAVERLTERQVAAVGVGFPATPLGKARIRFCLSAAHTRAQLDAALSAIEQAVRELGLQYSRRPAPRLPALSPAPSPACPR